jgi:hypothetical protein
MNNPEYITFGFKALRCKGFNPSYNSQKDYKTAKEAIDTGYTDSNFQGLSLPEVEAWEKTGGWVGWVVPRGYIAIDVEDPESISYLKSLFHSKGIIPPEHNTNKGKHFIFRTDKHLPGSQKIFLKCGLEVTYRVGGKNYLILSPTNGRTWEVPLYE